MAPNTRFTIMQADLKSNVSAASNGNGNGSVRRNSQQYEQSNTFVMVNVPTTVLHQSNVVKQIYSRLERYGPLVAFCPLKGLGRIKIVFHTADEANRAKAAIQKEGLLKGLVPSSAKVYSTKPYHGHHAQTDPQSGYLCLPEKDKDFLISPPASPPDGWEQSVDPAPVSDDAHNQLIAALQRLHQSQKTPGASSSATNAAQGSSSSSPSGQADQTTSTIQSASAGQSSLSSMDVEDHHHHRDQSLKQQRELEETGNDANPSNVKRPRRSSYTLINGTRSTPTINIDLAHPLPEDGTGASAPAPIPAEPAEKMDSALAQGYTAMPRTAYPGMEKSAI
eukprot:Clim_evm14s22 gene=Clim_evmTU14s22